MKERVIRTAKVKVAIQKSGNENIEIADKELKKEELGKEENDKTNKKNLG